MTIEEIRELIQLVNESGIAELEVQRAENRVRIRRSNSGSPQEIVLAPAAPAVVASPPTIPSLTSQFAPAAAAGPAAPQTDANTVFVKSPIVGTFYDSPSPDSPPFVKVGDRVSSGQVLCIIESMKLMNEIEAEVSGVLVSKLVDNGRPVEYGEALFAVQPG